MAKIEKTDIGVKMVDTGKATRMYHQRIVGTSNLGRELKISPKAHLCINEEGYKQEFYVPCVSVLIGIGKDHTADLVMSKDAWDALNNGEEISITTTKEWNEKYVYRKAKKK